MQVHRRLDDDIPQSGAKPTSFCGLFKRKKRARTSHGVCRRSVIAARWPISDRETRIYINAIVEERLKQLESVPVADGQFRVTVDIESGSALKLVAGMTGTAKIVTYAKAKAITVPSKVVFTDPADDTKKFVYVVGSNEKGERRDCTVGVTMGDRIEVLSGLSLGEQVLEEKPAH